MLLTRYTAERALEEALVQNPTPWGDHSRYVALACQAVAERCPGLDGDDAYIYGLLHDIGRHAGVTSERHMLDGYRYCTARGWTKAAQICITHSFPLQDPETAIGVWDMSQEEKAFVCQFVRNARYDDYDRLVQLCDALVLPSGFCLLEKRFVDVALRYGMHPAFPARWKATLEIKAHFEARMGSSIYSLLPGVVENSLK